MALAEAVALADAEALGEAVGLAVGVAVAVLPAPSAPLNCRLHPAGSGWSLQDSAMVLMPGLAEALLPNSTSGRLLAWQPSGVCLG